MDYPNLVRFIILLGNNEILALSKLKAFADDKINVTQNIEIVFCRIKNIVGKEENTCYQYFLFFPPNVFSKLAQCSKDYLPHNPNF